MDDATVGGGQPRIDPAQGDPVDGDPGQRGSGQGDPGQGDPGQRDPGQGGAPPDDPRARAKADVRAILAKALGLRRLVELAAEFGGAADAPRPELPRARYRRPGHRPAGPNPMT